MSLNANALKEFLTNGKFKKASKELKLYLKSGSATLEEIQKVLEELIENNYSNTIQSLFYMSVLSDIEDYFPVDDILKMDKDFVNKHCLLEGEEVIITFKGSLTMNKENVDGRVYLTNYRAIADGYYVDKDAPKPKVGSHGLIRDIAKGVKEARKVAVKAYIKKAIGQSLTSYDELSFGHQYPIMDSHSMKKGKALTYNIDIEYEDRKGRSKSTVLNLKLQYGKKSKLETSDGYNERKAKDFDLIEELLLKTRSS